MKKFLKAVWTFMNSKIFLYIILGVGIFLVVNVFNKNGNLRDDAKRKDKNIEALNSDVRNYVTKDSVHVGVVEGFEADVEELEGLNKELSDEIKDANGDVISYSNLVFRLRQDSTALAEELDSLKAIYEKPIRINDSTWNVDWTLPFVYDSVNYDIYHGRTQVMINTNLPLFNFIPGSAWFSLNAWLALMNATGGALSPLQ